MTLFKKELHENVDVVAHTNVCLVSDSLCVLNGKDYAKHFMVLLQENCHMFQESSFHTCDSSSDEPSTSQTPKCFGQVSGNG